MVVDAGSSIGNLRDDDPMTLGEVERLLAGGEAYGLRLGQVGLVALGEVGIGNTTVAAALAASLWSLPAGEAVGLGAGADSAIIERKTVVVTAALARWQRTAADAGGVTPAHRLAALGGQEFALLTGVVLVPPAPGQPSSWTAWPTVSRRCSPARPSPPSQRTWRRVIAAGNARMPVCCKLWAWSRCWTCGCVPVRVLGAALGAQLLLSGLVTRAQTARTAP